MSERKPTPDIMGELLGRPSDQPIALRIDRIRRDGGTQPRDGINDAYVEQLMRDIQAGDTLPPVHVYYDGTFYWMDDGYHRTRAHELLQRSTIMAIIQQGTQVEAQWTSYGANKNHGLNRTNGDKESASRAALRHPRAAGMSDREIARHVGVHHETIARYRREMETTGEIASQTVRTGGDGRTINTANIGAKPTAKPAQTMQTPVPAIDGNRPDGGEKKRLINFTDDDWAEMESKLAEREAMEPEQSAPVPQQAEQLYLLDADGEPGAEQSAPVPQQAEQPQPQKPIGEMTDEEIDAVFERYLMNSWESIDVEHGWIRMINNDLAVATVETPNVRSAMRLLSSNSYSRSEYERWLATLTAVTPSVIKPKPTTIELQRVAPKPIGETPVSQRDNYDSDEWYTPAEIVEAARRVLGQIDLDPASCELAQSVVKAERYWTKTQNGLAQPWNGRIWLNPPYSAPQPWIDKLISAAESADVTDGLVIVNNATETSWFQNLLCRYPCCFLNSRVAFWRHDHASAGARQGQAVFLIGHRFSRFAQEFGEHGVIVKGAW